jgi:hypothetical protein
LRRHLLLYEAWIDPIPGDAYQDPGFIPLIETLPADDIRSSLNGLNAFPADTSNNIAQEDDGHTMDLDNDDSQFDFMIGAESRTPPQRAIFSKQRWY